MKKIIITSAICGACWLPGHAQTIKVMTEQLAALHMLQKNIEKGYTLTTNGLQNVGLRQDEEYQQHAQYFKSLSTVNPILLNNSDQQKTIVYDKTHIPSIPQPADQHR